MSENYRRFEATDPFGRCWDVEFRWQQNAISIRHADAIDCKFYMSTGEERREQVVALAHPDLLAAAAARGRELTDAWVLRLAGLHLRNLIATWTDLERSLATVSRPALEALSLEIQADEDSAREKALLTH